MGLLLPMSKFINGWIPYWQHEESLTTVEENKDIFNDVLLFDWVCEADGSVKSHWYDPVPIDRLRVIGCPYWATFTSSMTGREAADMFDDVMASRNLAKKMIDVAKSIGAVGLDLDFESINFNHSGNSKSRLKANYPKFLAVVSDLSGALKVSATIPARLSDDDPDWAVYDYAAIGKSVDLVRIMSYDNHTGDGPAGPVSPLNWYKNVQQYAISRIPANKLQMGIPAYGYVWPDGTTLNSDKAEDFANSHGVKLRYDMEAAEGTFSYGNNVVWVATPASMAIRARVSREAGIAGVSIWSVGDEASMSWSLMRKAVAPSSSTVLVSVSGVRRQQWKYVRQVQIALNKEFPRNKIVINGKWNDETIDVYKKWQSRIGVQPNGVPNLYQLRRLGNKHGFRAVP